jgi:hypothetical protein
MMIAATAMALACLGCRTARDRWTAISEDEAIRLAKQYIAASGATQKFNRFVVVGPEHPVAYNWVDKDGRSRSGSATEVYGDLCNKYYVIECLRVPTDPTKFHFDPCKAQYVIEWGGVSPTSGSYAVCVTILVDRESGETSLRTTAMGKPKASGLAAGTPPSQVEHVLPPTTGLVFDYGSWPQGAPPTYWVHENTLAWIQKASGLAVGTPRSQVEHVLPPIGRVGDYRSGPGGGPIAYWVDDDTVVMCIYDDALKLAVPVLVEPRERPEAGRIQSAK